MITASREVMPSLDVMRAHGRRKKHVPIGRVISGVLLLVVTLIVLFPVLLMLVNSFRSNADLGAHPIGVPRPFVWKNYSDVFTQMGYLRSLLNTVIIAGSSVVLVVMTGSTAAWVIARYGRRWTRGAYRLFVAGLTVPVFVLTTPLYLFMRQLRLLDTYFAAILIYASFNLPFAVFFYASFIRSIPQELEDAAVIDGCGPFSTFRHIVFPLLKPATATIGIFIVLSIWNDIVVPLLFLSSDNLKTVTLSVYSFIGTAGSVTAAQLFPAVVLSTAPLLVIFLILQRHIVAGITAGMGKS